MPTFRPLQRIVAGTQAMTIYKPVKELATKAAEVALKIARGRPVIAQGEVDNGGGQEVPSILLQVSVVTKEQPQGHSHQRWLPQRGGDLTATPVPRRTMPSNAILETRLLTKRFPESRPWTVCPSTCARARCTGFAARTGRESPR